MESVVGAFEAKTNLSALLERVEKGETITITRRGVPVAKLTPIGLEHRRTRREAVEAMKAFGRGRRLDGMTFRELIDEGRRY